MAITVSFTASQVVGSPENIVITDASTGTDVSAVNRRIYVTNAAGTYLVPSGTTTDYELFPLADGATKTLSDILSQDTAANITLSYVDVSGNVVATGTILQGFTLYNETFYYSLTQAQAQQNQPPPNIIQDSNYYGNKMILRVEIDSGNLALEYGSDITTAQGAYDRASYMVSKQSDYF